MVSLFQLGVYGANNTDDTTTHGFYVIQLLSDAYTLKSKWEGGVGADEIRAPQKSEGNRAFISRHDTRETTGDEPRDSRSVRGAPSPAGTARIERELGRQRPARYPDDA